MECPGALRSDAQMRLRRNSVVVGVSSALLSFGCQGPAPAAVDDGHVPPLPLVVRAFAKANGAETTLGAVLDALAKADVVFCGETHLDDVTHRVELAIYDGLLARRGNRVVLAMEMFTTQAQTALDEYVAGQIDERTFRARSSPWGNYDTGYRPMIERARAARAPVVGSNAPQMLARKISAGGASAFAALSPAERALLPATLLPNSVAYWQRFDRATRGHAGMGDGPDPDKLLYSTQSLWDNTMGWSCAQALTRWPGHLVMHVNGGFHSAHGEGTAAQCRQRRPDARIVTVAIETTSDLAAVDFEPAHAEADYVVFATARARGLDDGMHAVASHREQRYRLEVPARATAPLALLIWLPGDGLCSDDAAAMWSAALGEDAAVAVLEPQFGQIEMDLRRGGRWFFVDTFDKDVASASRTVSEVREYVARYWPIDRARVVVAGEGTGGTVAVAAALWGDGPRQHVLAFEPRGHRKLGEQGVPETPTAVAGVRVFTTAAEQEFWQQEFAAHRHRALAAAVEATADPVSTVRAALGLSSPVSSSPARTLVALPSASPLGQQWQRTAAATLGRDGTTVKVVGPDDTDAGAGARALLVAGESPQVEAALAAREVRVFSPAEAAAAGLPPASGAFGGTTILVVPAGSPATVRDAWRAVAAQNPMQRHGRFFRLEHAFEDEAPTLADALASMVAARRRNALVVPARFCAEAAIMQALARAAEGFEGQVDLAWLPGLGGRLASVAAR